MKTQILVALLIGVAGLSSAHAGTTLELEAGAVFPGYIDISVPGDTGSRFSMTDDLDAVDTAAVRLRVGTALSEKHWIGLLIAPLTVDASGTLDRDIDFDGTTYAAGTAVDASFRFDSYRLIYRYLVHQSDTWSFHFGLAGKIRDAAITLESESVKTVNSNTGFVPLLSWNLTWMPTEKLHLVFDGEALAAPQGRAEDVLLAAQYQATDDLALRVGYRVLEGGADNDDVYTFSLFHYVVAGAVWAF